MGKNPFDLTQYSRIRLDLGTILYEKKIHYISLLYTFIINNTLIHFFYENRKKYNYYCQI